MSDSKVLGYHSSETGYEPIVQPPGLVYTSAFIICCQCSGSISSHGGPKRNSYCLPCYNTNIFRDSLLSELNELKRLGVCVPEKAFLLANNAGPSDWECMSHSDVAEALMLKASIS